MSYFDGEHKIAEEGKSGEISRWRWDLEGYGISKNDFRNVSSSGRSIPVICDGELKAKLALKAIRHPEIKGKFKPHFQSPLIEKYKNKKYACIHIRRGDYLNVASHLVEDYLFDSLMQKLRPMVDHLVVVSDSKVAIDNFKEINRWCKANVCVLDSSRQVPDIVIHALMASADLLVCSNSQFSLSAGLLSNGLVFLPKKWFGEREKPIEDIIGKLSDFCIMRGDSF
jgi:hypothetical protein